MMFSTPQTPVTAMQHRAKRVPGQYRDPQEGCALPEARDLSCQVAQADGLPDVVLKSNGCCQQVDGSAGLDEALLPTGPRPGFSGKFDSLKKC